ncbi:MAG: Uncharacterised protein [Polaribacter sejongensis]|nr:MAG: Uncharacterised protein [Polaribacter sejongensis]
MNRFAIGNIPTIGLYSWLPLIIKKMLNENKIKEKRRNNFNS